MRREIIPAIRDALSRPIGNGSPCLSLETNVPEDDSLPDFPEDAWRGVFAEYRQAMNGTTEAPTSPIS